MQPIADALPRNGSDGKPLLEGRKVAQKVLTRYGVVELSLFSGRCQTTGKFEMPFKTLYCQGERHPVSPLLERGREASQHLGVLADVLFGSDKDPAAKEAWLAQHRRELKAIGPANLIKTLSVIDFRSVRKHEAKKTARREVAYSKGHEEHMHYHCYTRRAA